MSRHTDRFGPRRSGLVAGVLALLAPLAGAQTIADYSRAQRAALENAMAQAAARSAGLGPAAAAVAASAPAAPSAPASAHAASLPPPAPDIRVSGVFASRTGAIAEVVVNSTPYLLGSGERVPGTAWDVHQVSVDRVVLARHGGAPGLDTSGGLQVFALPTLR
jgi:hypothetical protein